MQKKLMFTPKCFMVPQCSDKGQCPQLWHNRRKVQSLGFMAWKQVFAMKQKSLQYIVNITVQKSIRNTDFSICILLF